MNILRVSYLLSSFIFCITICIDTFFFLYIDVFIIHISFWNWSYWEIRTHSHVFFANNNSAEFVIFLYFNFPFYPLACYTRVVSRKQTSSSSIAASSLSWFVTRECYELLFIKLGKRRTLFRTISSVLIGGKGSLIKRNTRAAIVSSALEYRLTPFSLYLSLFFLAPKDKPNDNISNILFTMTGIFQTYVKNNHLKKVLFK